MAARTSVKRRTDGGMALSNYPNRLIKMPSRCCWPSLPVCFSLPAPQQGWNKTVTLSWLSRQRILVTSGRDAAEGLFASMLLVAESPSRQDVHFPFHARNGPENHSVSPKADACWECLSQATAAAATEMQPDAFFFFFQHQVHLLLKVFRYFY